MSAGRSALRYTLEAAQDREAAGAGVMRCVGVGLARGLAVSADV